MNAILGEEISDLLTSISIALLSPRQNKLWTQHVEIIHAAIEHLGKTDFDFRQNHKAKEESKLDGMENAEELSSLKTESDYFNMLPSQGSHHSYEREHQNRRRTL